MYTGSPEARVPQRAATRSSSVNYYAQPQPQQQPQSAPPAAEDLILEAKRLLDQSKAESPAPTAAPSYTPNPSSNIAASVPAASGASGVASATTESQTIVPAAATIPTTGGGLSPSHPHEAVLTAPTVHVDLSVPPVVGVKHRPHSSAAVGPLATTFDHSATLQYADRQRLIYLVGELSAQLGVEVQSRAQLKQQAIEPLVAHIKAQDIELQALREQNALLQMQGALAVKERESLEQRVTVAEQVASEVTERRAHLNADLAGLVESVTAASSRTASPLSSGARQPHAANSRGGAPLTGSTRQPPQQSSRSASANGSLNGSYSAPQQPQASNGDRASATHAPSTQQPQQVFIVGGSRTASTASQLSSNA